MRIEVRKPQSVWDYLVLVPVMVVGALLMVIGLVAGFLLLLAMPAIVWWKRRQQRHAGPRVIDAEFTVPKDE